MVLLEPLNQILGLHLEKESLVLWTKSIVALEVEANFTSTGKWKGKVEYGDRRRGNEEANSSVHVKETQEHKLEKMNKLIRNLSNELVKMELENKKPP